MKTTFTKLIAMILAVVVFHPLASAAMHRASRISSMEKMMYCLSLSGEITYKGTRLDSVELRLYNKNQMIGSSTYTINDKFMFLLEQNTSYTLEISKKGMLTRYVRIETSLPEHAIPRKAKELYFFDFELNMLKTDEVKRNPYSELPIAIIRYDQKRKAFDYSKNYTAEIKKRIGQLD